MMSSIYLFGLVGVETMILLVLLVPIITFWVIFSRLRKNQERIIELEKEVHFLKETLKRKSY